MSNSWGSQVRHFQCSKIWEKNQAAGRKERLSVRSSVSPYEEWRVVPRQLWQGSIRILLMGGVRSGWRVGLLLRYSVGERAEFESVVQVKGYRAAWCRRGAVRQAISRESHYAAMRHRTLRRAHNTLTWWSCLMAGKLYATTTNEHGSLGWTIDLSLNIHRCAAHELGWHTRKPIMKSCAEV